MAAAIVALSLLAISTSFVANFSTPKLLVLSLGAAVLLMASALRDRILLPSKYALVLMLAYIIGAELSPDSYWACFGTYNDWTFGLIGMFITLVFYSCSKSLEWHPEEIICFVGALIGVHASGEWLGAVSSGVIDVVNGRALSTLGHPVDLGIVLAIIAPIAYKRSWLLTACVMCGILASGSRAACLASIIGIWAAQKFR